MFKLDDKVVYPGLGVAAVFEIVIKKVLNKPVSFMKLVFMYKDMTILVPEYNIDSIGLRLPSCPKTIELVLQEIKKRPEKKSELFDITPSAWSRRHKDYQFKIQAGDIFELAKIYRDLMLASGHKDLSFGERALLQLSETLIAQEMQVSLKAEREIVIQSLRLPFKQFTLQEDLMEENQAPVQRKYSSSAATF